MQYYFQFTVLSNFFSDETTAGDITFAYLIYYRDMKQKKSMIS